MRHKLRINTIEKIAKTLIFVPLMLLLSLLLLTLYFSYTGKSLPIDGNYSILGLLINIGVLMLIFISIFEFIRTYRGKAKK
jgi:hypothetical protein